MLIDIFRVEFLLISVYNDYRFVGRISSEKI
jgi:hypothetical protein